VLLPIAIILRNVGTKTDLFPVFVLACILLIGLIQVGVNGWPDLVKWWEEKWARDWPTVPAVIDLVTTATWAQDEPLAGGGPPTPTIYEHKALLTYSYRNPEPQSGDYSRSFGSEDDAKDWADSCKGLKVMVRVDPRDPARSVLRAEDIDAALARTQATSS
jgi:Protein of unknown function (DUF3592)